MKVRIIRKPEFTALHHVQIKTFWWPFWRTVAYDDLYRCKQIAETIIKTKSKNEIVFEGETK